MTNVIPKLEILIGLPGSGKSTYYKEECKSNSNSIYLSSEFAKKRKNILLSMEFVTP